MDPNRILFPCMMWPLAEFYNGSNELAGEQLRLAAIFREKGREYLTNYVCPRGPKGPKTLHSWASKLFPRYADTFMSIHSTSMGLQFEDEEWEALKSKALKIWSDDGLLLGLLGC